MDFFKMTKFKKTHVLNAEDGLEIKLAPTKVREAESSNDFLKVNAGDSSMEIEDDEDNNFITTEVTRRLKELRKNSFMVLIPEEAYLEEESISCEWGDLKVEDRYPWCGFDVLYDKYSERMLFFDKIIAQLMDEHDSCNNSNLSPQPPSEKFASTLQGLTFKRREEHQERKLLCQIREDPFQDLEIAYVAQISLSWEALHCQYTQLSQKISSQPENNTYYSHATQRFQQFQVLLQRFIENEPFEEGHRLDIYARSRYSMPMLLHVPSFQEPDPAHKDLEGVAESPVLTSDLTKVIVSSIMTFHLFLKLDKRKSGVLNFFGGHNQVDSSLQVIRASLDKKEAKLKELSRKKKGWKKNFSPTTPGEVELLLALIDVKVVSRVLRMVKITKEQLLWCEEKMSKLDIPESRLQRDGSPVLFPC